MVTIQDNMLTKHGKRGSPDMEDNKWVVNHTAIDKVLPSTPVYTLLSISLQRNAVGILINLMNLY